VIAGLPDATDTKLLISKILNKNLVFAFQTNSAFFLIFAFPEFLGYTNRQEISTRIIC